MDEFGCRQKQETGRHANNRGGEQPPTFRQRERAMPRFQAMKTLQKLASVHANVHNHFSAERHLVSRDICKERRQAALAGRRALAS